MKSDEVLTALRCCASGSCDGCPLWDDDPEDTTCADGLMAAAADLIEFQQQGLEALTKMDEGLKKRGGTLKEFLRRGDEAVQGHMDPTGPRGEPGVIGDEGCGGDDPGAERAYRAARHRGRSKMPSVRVKEHLLERGEGY